MVRVTTEQLRAAETDHWPGYAEWVAARLRSGPVTSDGNTMVVPRGLWRQVAGEAMARSGKKSAVAPEPPPAIDPSRSWVPLHGTAKTVEPNVASVSAWADRFERQLPTSRFNPRAQFADLRRRCPLPERLNPAAVCRWTYDLHAASDRGRGIQPEPYGHAADRWGFPLPHGPDRTFGAAYVISLRRTPERLLAFEEQFPRDWPYRHPAWLPAVDGRAEPIVAAWPSPASPRHPASWQTAAGNRGAMGCRASWLAVLDRLIADGVDRPALILEDDCRFADGAAEAIRRTLALVEAADPGWELLFLGGQHHDRDTTPPLPVAPGLVRCADTGRTHALVIHPRFFRSLREFWSGYVNHVDWGLRTIQADRRMYAADPFVASQRANTSTITGKAVPERGWGAPPPPGRPAAVFSHRGDVGDILAALPTVRAASRAHGGGELVICPADFTRQRMTPAVVDGLRPLLEAQPYIKAVRFAAAPEGVELDAWRQRSHPKVYSLADRTLDLLDWSHAERDVPWLTVPPNPVARVVFARSPRYRNPAFPWRSVVERYGREAVFVGHPSEHAEFVASFGPVPYVETPDHLALARVLAGAELVVVNQTSTYWVSLGLGRPTVLEECPDGHNFNCRHSDQGVTCVLRGDESLPTLPPRPVSRRVAVLSLAIDRATTVGDLTFPNKRVYCDRHGYGCVLSRRSHAPDRPPAWSKIAMLRDHLPHHDWLMWSDADSAFTNLGRPLDALLADDADLVIARDGNGINSGSFLIRNTPVVAAFLERVWGMTECLHHVWWEQAAMAAVLDSGSAGVRVRYVEKRAINSYPDDWQPGDLVYHTPGRPDRLELLRGVLAHLPTA